MNVVHPLSGSFLNEDQKFAFNILDETICRAVDSCKNAMVPQGLIVALLHSHAHAQTHILVTTGDDE